MTEETAPKVYGSRGAPGLTVLGGDGGSPRFQHPA